MRRLWDTIGKSLVPARNSRSVRPGLGVLHTGADLRFLAFQTRRATVTEKGNRIVDMKRIIVIGSPGTGKSTFARKLKEKTGLPLYYLDLLFHRPDKTTATREEFDRSLQAILQTETWILDGNYQRTLPLRFEACTDVFFLDFPLDACLDGAASRVGTAREDMPWIEEEFDPAFRQYILDFPKDQLPRIRELTARYRESRRITVFHSRAEADRWLEGQA